MNAVTPEQLEQLKQIEEMKKKILGSILTKEAYERLSRVKSVNEELANQVELYLIQIFQSGKIQKLITDEKMKELLKALSGKKEISIRRK
jgi:programmed cell death protein 5